MTVTITPQALSGTVAAIPSKSVVHRLLIGAALGDREVFLPCLVQSRDMTATAGALASLGAGMVATADGFSVTPLGQWQSGAVLDCDESGSTYRFLVPTACTSGQSVTFRLAGRLPDRPMDPLWAVLESHGIRVRGKGTPEVSLSGRLTAGRYELAGDVSSQFVSGLLFALPLLSGDSEVVLTSPAQSAGYMEMTRRVLEAFSVQTLPTRAGFHVPGGQRYHTPPTLSTEGDWSGAAFWLCAAAARGQGITVTGLARDSVQGDRAVCELLSRFGAEVTQTAETVTVRPGRLRAIRIDAADIPDLVPALAVAAAAAEGCTVIDHADRLCHKESDRAHTVCRTLCALGGLAESDGHTMTITGTGSLTGGQADSFGDHRIAMMAAAASVLCREAVTVTGAEAVDKSYPGFFADFVGLHGQLREGGQPS
ncbi:MAG: 3-phosphoshikimate 1-carboxyvinyltransferase [Eubacteriales bacterium]